MKKCTEVQHMASILHKYEHLSEQKINFGKSDIVFIPNTCDLKRRGIREMWEMKLKDRLGKYLGMPMYIGRNKREIFRFTSDKIQSKLQPWSNKELSKAGKLTLVGTST
ncbi:uncharacterized protein LOC141693402 [Apium graveolens]|uniref:uncharacterized protein LOC141693402 n=1 Tax=Apium graveolens TaxID=4045 RepID=UPI003D7900DA